MIGQFLFDQVGQRWVVIRGGVEVRELHCGDVLRVRECADEAADWLSARMEMDGDGMWYLVTDAGDRDDFELLYVLIED